MKKSKIFHYFTEVITSESVGVKKPNPKVFLHAMKKAGSSPKESLMIGDNIEADIQGALATGMKAKVNIKNNPTEIMKLKHPILIFLLIQAFLLSCVNNADFDQINIDAEPVFDVPLIFFELDQLDFINDTDGTEILTVSDTTDLEIFQSSAVRDNLVRLEIRYDIELSSIKIIVREYQ